MKTQRHAQCFGLCFGQTVQDMSAVQDFHPSHFSASAVADNTGDFMPAAVTSTVVCWISPSNMTHISRVCPYLVRLNTRFRLLGQFSPTMAV